MTGLVIIVFVAAVFVALGYKWGSLDAADKEYMRGMEDAGELYQSSLVRLNGQIRDLEQENEMLHIRLGDGIAREVE